MGIEWKLVPVTSGSPVVSFWLTKGCIDVESGVEWCRTVYLESVYTSVSGELSSEQTFTFSFTTVGHLIQKTTFSPTLPATHFLFPLGFDVIPCESYLTYQKPVNLIHLEM